MQGLLRQTSMRPRYTACMNLKLLIVLVALSLPLAACGNKGRLVMPTPTAAELPVMESPPATEPTESELPAEIPPPAGAEPATASPPPLATPADTEDGDG